MPLYEYACDRCKKTFEVIQKFSDEPLTTHKDCGGKVERLLSAPALQFKGSGWYVTDYARGNGSANGGKTEAKTENKSETKTETKSSETKSSETKASETKASSTSAASESK